ncbi:MAG: hypothetical protein RIK87_09260 [Fuerstiella sp.]
MLVTCLAFGSAVAAVGIALVLFHVRAHRRHLADDELCDADHQFFEHQYARRMQTSALAITLGALIGLWGYLLRVFERSPIFATCYVIGLLVLTLWLILLAISDAIATRIYAGKMDRRHRQARQSLQQALDEVRQAHGLEPNK